MVLSIRLARHLPEHSSHRPCGDADLRRNSSVVRKLLVITCLCFEKCSRSIYVLRFKWQRHTLAFVEGELLQTRPRRLCARFQRLDQSRSFLRDKFQTRIEEVFKIGEFPELSV